MHLVAINFCLNLVNLVPHFIDPSLHDYVGLSCGIIRVMQSPKILSNNRCLVVILRCYDILPRALHPQFFDPLELLAQSFINEVI